MTEDASKTVSDTQRRRSAIEYGLAVLRKLRTKGALVSCNECGGNEFNYVGHSTDAVIILAPDPLKLEELLPMSRSFKVHVVGCTACTVLKTFLDSE